MMLTNVAFGIAIALMLISLVVLFCVLLVKLYIRKIKNYTQVIYEKDLDFQKAINTTIIETQEQVLNNISQDLHDDAGQQLTAINFQLENLKLDSPELITVLKPVTESVSGLARSIRSISHSLNNQLITRQDLFKAIAAEVERLRNNLSLNIEITVDKQNDKDFSSDEKIMIYRIFQEIINNILKHSKADLVHIDLNTKPDFKMSVRDNGKGFDSENVKDKTLGLLGMMQRAAFIDYHIDINSSPNQGTTVVLSENLQIKK